MNLLDIIAIATLIILILKGIYRGFIREIASFVGIVMGIWMAYVFHPQMAEYLKAYLPPGPHLSLFSFMVILTGTILICNLLGWFFKLLLRKALFGWADRLLGAGFAAIKGTLFIYLIIIILTFFVPAKTPLLAESKLAPQVISSFQSISRFISPERYRAWKERISQKTEEMTDMVSEKIKDSAE
jgi:membrane protein required for colicin V production